MKLFLGSVCFAQNGDRILLLQRNHPPFQGKWDGLQGRIEFGESPAQAAAREVYEESGLTLGAMEPRGHLLLYNTDEQTTSVVYLFVGQAEGGALRGSAEGMPVWVPVSELEQMDLVGFVRTTLPLVLSPNTFLTGVIWHNSHGDLIQCALQPERVAVGPTAYGNGAGDSDAQT